ncbi:MAG: glycerol-3-phosphate 1-O-acyltransferase PlsY [Opitutales bacterium]
MSLTNAFLSLVVGYILGAIPFAVIIARAKGVDILKYGSGNPGATNVKRACGTFAGRLCFILDALKGFIASYWMFALSFFGYTLAEPTELNYMAFLGLFGALLGHSFSVFLKFKGGKGVSVIIGGLFSLLIYPILISLIVWLVVFFASKMVSLASILMSVSVAVSALIINGANSIQFIFALIVCIFITYRHRSNIVRICNGTEHKFTKK